MPISFGVHHQDRRSALKASRGIREFADLFRVGNRIGRWTNSFDLDGSRIDPARATASGFSEKRLSIKQASMIGSEEVETH
jgi:hypothetical protein